MKICLTLALVALSLGASVRRNLVEAEPYHVVQSIPGFEQVFPEPYFFESIYPELGPALVPPADVSLIVNNFLTGFIKSAFNVKTEDNIVNCVENPALFYTELRNSFNPNTEFPGHFFSNILNKAFYFSNYRIFEPCGGDIKSYVEYAGKLYDMAGGFNFFANFVDSKFALQRQFFNASALFNAAHFLDSGFVVGQLFLAAVNQAEKNIDHGIYMHSAVVNPNPNPGPAAPVIKSGPPTGSLIPPQGPAPVAAAPKPADAPKKF